MRISCIYAQNIPFMDLAMFFTMVTTQHSPSLSQFDLSAMRQFSSFLMCTCMCTLQTVQVYLAEHEPEPEQETVVKGVVDHCH